MVNKQLSIRKPVKISKALGNKSRLRVIAALVYNEELCVCQIIGLLGYAASTVSRHISVLQSADLVESRKEGRWVYYKLSDNISEDIKNWLQKEVLNTSEAKKDRERLMEILSMTPEELCRNEKV